MREKLCKDSLKKEKLFLAFGGWTGNGEISKSALWETEHYCINNGPHVKKLPLR